MNNLLTNYYTKILRFFHLHPYFFHLHPYGRIFSFKMTGSQPKTKTGPTAYERI
ncbi:hypothetical protein ACJX0J_034288, partial [Zea mays]